MSKKGKKNVINGGVTVPTSKCLECEFGKLTEDKKVLCQKDHKFYIYGKRIVCNK